MTTAVEQERVSTRQLLTQLPRALGLIWAADRTSAVSMATLTLGQALLPAGLAWVGKLIIDAVVQAGRSPGPETQALVWRYVGWELALAVATLTLGRLGGFVHDVMRVNLGNLINERILDKALTLELRHFEDAATYDLMQNARREASTRPLALALSSIAVLRNLVTLSTFAIMLWSVAWWAVLVLLVAAVPTFVAETSLSGNAFTLYSNRAADARRLNYLEWIATRDSHVKEVKLFGLGPTVVSRYRALFRKFLGEDRALAFRRLWMGTLFGAVSASAFYACYLTVASRAARAEISVGDLTLYLAVFRQGQGAFEAVLNDIASMYENGLFMSNLFQFFGLETSAEQPRLSPAKTLPAGKHTIEFKNVSFRYAPQGEWALKNVSLTIRPGEKLALVGENGAGKSTLVKLLLRLYEPTEGEVLLDGVDVRDLEVSDLRGRVGAVFQDFVRYQFSAGENVGLGHPEKLFDSSSVRRAAEASGAHEVIENLPAKYETVLGGWFEKGQELSGGQWQKLAVARAFMRQNAEVLILDEPTASIDAQAEATLFERFRTLAEERSAIIISHRFSTVRMADRIAFLEKGQVVELGSHEELLALGGRYAALFTLQAQGYR
jgi:ATP-binding cassette subfamily B protein